MVYNSGRGAVEVGLGWFGGKVDVRCGVCGQEIAAWHRVCRLGISRHVSCMRRNAQGWLAVACADRYGERELVGENGVVDHVCL